MRPYFISGLPRSRTAWLATFLTHADSFCHHEATIGCDSMVSLKNALGKVPIGTHHIGDADPNLGLIPQSILDTFPRSKFVFIHRDLEECVDSEWTAILWEKLTDQEDVTKDGIRELMKEASLGLAHLARSIPEKQRIIVPFAALDKQQTVRQIWDFCVPGTAFPFHRYQQLQDLRVTQIFRKVLLRHPNQPFHKLIDEHRKQRELILEKQSARN